MLLLLIFTFLIFPALSDIFCLLLSHFVVLFFVFPRLLLKHFGLSTSSTHLLDILSLHHVLIPHLHPRVEEALDEVG